MTQLEAAIQTIRTIHSDTSVPLEQTLEWLEELRDEINELIAAVEEDIERVARNYVVC